MKLFKPFSGIVGNPSNIRHHTLNWHQSEVASRHPTVPVGWVARESGQLDLYAGKARAILATNGLVYLSGSLIGLVSDVVRIKTNTIQDFTIQGKHFAPDLFNGRKVPKLKGSVEDLRQRCFFAGPGGSLIPFEEFFELGTVFDPAIGLLEYQEEQAFCISRALTGLDVPLNIL